MAISKQNVFLVSGRRSVPGGDPRGEVINCLVCSVDDAAIRDLLEREVPDFRVLSITSLVNMESTVKKMKAVLAGADTSWQVLIDPMLQAQAAA